MTLATTVSSASLFSKSDKMWLENKDTLFNFVTEIYVRTWEYFVEIKLLFAIIIVHHICLQMFGMVCMWHSRLEIFNMDQNTVAERSNG